MPRKIFSFLALKYSHEMFYFIGQDVKFSFGIGLEPEEETSNINDTDRLMSSLGISSASSDKSNVGQNQYQKKEFQKDDAKIIERYQKKIPNAKMMELRQSLPAWKEKDSITEALKNHQVMVISGMTGCGKSMCLEILGQFI